MENHERRGPDRDLARLLRAVFGDGADRGLAARVYDLEREASERAVEIAQLSESAREAALRARDFSDHPLLDKDVARRVVAHVSRSDEERVRGRALWDRVTGQAIIMVLGIVQTVVLGWLALHVSGVRFPP